MTTKTKAISATSLCFIFLISAFKTIAVNAQQLSPGDSCGNNRQAVISFADPVLESIVRDALSIGSDGELTCELAAELSALNASGPGPTRYVSGSPEWRDPDQEFHDLSGIQNLTGLTRLSMNNLVL